MFYLTVNIRDSEALFLSPGVTGQAGLGAATEPHQTGVTPLVPHCEGPRLTLGHLDVPTDLLVGLDTLGRLQLHTALLSY